MKKTLIKLITAVLLIGAFGLVAPKTDVQAYTCYGDMTYEEVCTYWSSTPLWKQIFDLESANSGYLDNAKADLYTYFKVSLNDYVWKPDAVAASRPLTSNYLRDVLAFSNPNIVNVIRGGQTDPSELRSVLWSEVKYCAPQFSDSDVSKCVDELLGCLRGCGVDTVAKYDGWKRLHGGRSAFEYFMGGRFKACGYGCYPYGYYWGWGCCYPTAPVVCLSQLTKDTINAQNAAAGYVISTADQTIDNIAATVNNVVENSINQANDFAQMQADMMAQFGSVPCY